ncbi:MAG: branched-chain amino acid ABC transporter permease [Archaeoglobaceae archaeon]|uniref:Branched-chain amino acid ABC transporter permease n=1 Tax=Archaeoglobus fulgidus TaxID=2234 RepID=A0A7J3M0C0_ARCFL
MIELLEIAVFGTAMGGIFALLASGFSLIFGVSRILNFAHGVCFAVSAYVAIYLIKELSTDVFSASLLGVLFAVLIGFAVYALTRPIRHNVVMVIIVTLAFALLIEQFLLLSFGNRGLTMPPFVEGIQVVYENLRIAKIRLLAIAIAVAVLVALEVFISKTLMGKRINAVSQDSEASMLIGIDVEKVLIATFALSSALAGIAGILYAQIFNVYPATILRVLIYAFAVVILGGLGSFRGSVLASFIIGYIFVATMKTLGAQWSEFVMLITIIAILAVRPTGLFGVRE